MKINTLKQLRRATENGVVLITDNDQLQWKSYNDLGLATTTELETQRTAIEQALQQVAAGALKEADISRIVQQVNTAKFVVQETLPTDLSTVDENDLVLVGDGSKSYEIYAKVGTELKRLGSTEVSLENYVTNTSLETTLGEVKTEVNNYADTEIQKAKTELKNSISTIEQKVSTVNFTVNNKSEKVQANGGETTISFSTLGATSAGDLKNILFFRNGVLLEEGATGVHGDYTGASVAGGTVSIQLNETAEQEEVFKAVFFTVEKA